MAYLSFSPIVAEGATRFAGSAADAARFSTLELQVIGLAQRERPSSVAPDGWAGRLLSRLFGIEAPRPLADARLEQLRRFVILARHAPQRIGDQDVRQLIEAGFTAGQARGLLAYLRPRSAGGAALA